MVALPLHSRVDIPVSPDVVADSGAPLCAFADHGLSFGGTR